MTSQAHPHLLLASASPRRHDLLRRLGVPFEILVPRGVDESAARGTAALRARQLAVRKAEAGLAQHASSRPDLVVVGADTLVVLGEGDGEKVLGKPADRSDAVAMLSLLAGRTHRVVSGVAVAGRDEPTRAGVEESEVRFRELSREEIETYVASGDAEGKAGAYGIQSRGRALVRDFSGCFYNIVGLPMSLLVSLLPIRVGASWVCDCRSHPLQRGNRCCGETSTLER